MKALTLTLTLVETKLILEVAQPLRENRVRTFGHGRY